MSCGKPHEIDCGQILNEVYLFLDLECADDRRSAIHRRKLEPTLPEIPIHFRADRACFVLGAVWSEDAV